MLTFSSLYPPARAQQIIGCLERYANVALRMLTHRLRERGLGEAHGRCPSIDADSQRGLVKLAHHADRPGTCSDCFGRGLYEVKREQAIRSHANMLMDVRPMRGRQCCSRRRRRAGRPWQSGPWIRTYANLDSPSECTRCVLQADESRPRNPSKAGDPRIAILCKNGPICTAGTIGLH